MGRVLKTKAFLRSVKMIKFKKFVILVRAAQLAETTELAPVLPLDEEHKCLSIAGVCNECGQYWYDWGQSA